MKSQEAHKQIQQLALIKRQRSVLSEKDYVAEFKSGEKYKEKEENEN